MRLYLKGHPEKNRKRILYQKTKLTANLSIIFPNKNRLKKSLLLVYVNKFYPIGIAASVLLIWMFSFFFQFSENQVYTARVDRPVVVVLEEKLPEEQPSVNIEIPAAKKDIIKVASFNRQETILAEVKPKIRFENMPQQTINKETVRPQKIAPIIIPNYTYHKKEPIIIIEEENISVGEYLARVFRKKSMILKRRQRMNSWNDVFAWIDQKTGIHISQQYKVGKPRT